MMRKLMAVLYTALLLATVALADKTVSDDVVYDQVRLKLAQDRDVGGGNINVKVSQGVVTLSGTVKKDMIRTRAEKLAKKVKGVQQVVNELKVLQTP